MKKILLILFLLPLMVVAQKKKKSKEVKCDTALWSHVYNPQRLYIREECKTVTGIVDYVAKEEDGDYHIRLKLDTAFSYMLNECNDYQQHNCLVLEIICVNGVTQQNAKVPCKGCKSAIYVPKKDERISATGTYCLDAEHGWTELHPITNISVVK